MAKQIIILEVKKGPGGDMNVRWLFWLAVAANAQQPLPGAISAWRGAQAADITAIQSGAVLEEDYTSQWVPGATKAQIQADLVARGNARQAEITALSNPLKFYGVFWDTSGGWSA